MREHTPILPAHIEETIQAIAALHARHYRESTPVQRAVDQMTHVIGRPRFVGLLTAIVVVWVGLNLSLHFSGRPALDPAPFYWLVNACTVLGLYITVLILITQRRENQLTEHREQLTLELAILGEQKNAKIIELLEEMRRDNPLITNRVDREAEALSVPADPEAVLDAIKDSHEETMANVQSQEGTPPPPAEGEKA